jgi:hypothetical protein
VSLLPLVLFDFLISSLNRHFCCFLTYITAIDEEDFNAHKQWLKHSSEPWQRVLELWEITAAARLKEIRRSEGNIADVFKDWPRLADPRGYSLVSEDHLHVLYLVIY